MVMVMVLFDNTKLSVYCVILGNVLLFAIIKSFVDTASCDFLSYSYLVKSYPSITHHLRDTVAL